MMPEHRIELASSFLSDTWTAICSCGWIGERRDDIGAATVDVHRHREESEQTEHTPSPGRQSWEAPWGHDPRRQGGA